MLADISAEYYLRLEWAAKDPSLQVVDALARARALLTSAPARPSVPRR